MGTISDLRQQPPLLDALPGRWRRTAAFRPVRSPDMAKCNRRTNDNILGRATVDRNGSSTHDVVAVNAVPVEAPSLAEAVRDAPAGIRSRSAEAANAAPNAAHLATLVCAQLRPLLHAFGRSFACNAAAVNTVTCTWQMVKCPDRKGVIAALAQLLYGLGCNILASDQFTAEVPLMLLMTIWAVRLHQGSWTTSQAHQHHICFLQEGMYFQRIRFDMSDIVVGTANASVLERAIAEVPLHHLSFGSAYCH